VGGYDGLGMQLGWILHKEALCDVCVVKVGSKGTHS
jgi:hypothetical protein